MPTTQARLVRGVGIPVMRTVRIRVCSFSVRTAIILSMRIWWVPETSRCERSLLGKTGQGRAACQSALMCRAMKPKPSACKGTRSCGGAQTQAPVLQPGVTDGFLIATNAEGHKGAKEHCSHNGLRALQIVRP